MHTQPVDNNGTDLRTVYKCIAPECKILFSESRLASNELNAMYKAGDITKSEFEAAKRNLLN